MEERQHPSITISIKTVEYNKFYSPRNFIHEIEMPNRIDHQLAIL